MAHHSSEFSPSPLKDEVDKLKEQLGDELGATGKHPEGKLRKDDDGEIRFGITEKDGKVVIAFGHPVEWVGMNPDQAEGLATILLERARQARVSLKNLQTQSWAGRRCAMMETLILVMALKMQAGVCVPIEEGWVCTPAKVAPFDACDSEAECRRKINEMCKDAGHGGVKKGSAKVTEGSDGKTCAGDCTKNGAVAFVSCLADDEPVTRGWLPNCADEPWQPFCTSAGGYKYVGPPDTVLPAAWGG